MHTKLEVLKEMEEGGKFHVLILEDQAADAEIMVHTLRKSGIDPVCQRVDTKGAYLAALDQSPDIILSDFHLPQFDALHALQLLKEKELDIPFIVVTGTASEKTAVACLEEGADDYLQKDRLERLGPAVMNALREKRLREGKGQAEKAAESSARQWQATFNAITHPVFLLDREGKILRSNLAAETFAGLPGNYQVGTTSCVLSPCPLHAKDQCPVGRMWQSQRRESTEIKSGQRWFNVSADPVFDEQGTLTSAVHMIVDVTEHKLAEEQLKESEERYRLLVEYSPDAILVHQEGRIAFINAAGGLMAGVKQPQEIIGRPFMPFVHPEYRELVAQRVALMMADGSTPPPVELKLVRDDGISVAVEVSSVSCLYDGKPAVLVFMRDLAERKKLEAQLHQSQKMESLGRLAGGIAHDFNNLLTVIMSNSELLMMQKGLEGKIHDRCKIMLETSERASKLTKQLLVFSSKQEMDPVCMDVNQIIKEMKKMLPSLVGEDIECRFDLASETPWVKADPSMIEQIVMNLAVNARDAMPKGGLLAISTSVVDLDVEYARLHPEAVPGRYVRITTADTGTGMTPEVREHIFEPFFTTKGDKGTGLGLATVYGHVKKLGGHIMCYTEIGRGTEFKIYLPACRDIEMARPEELAEVRDLPVGKETILLVEDESTLRIICEQVLSKLGYTIITAATGAEAMQKAAAAERKIDLLLTDVVLPQKRGEEVAGELRESRPDLKVLFMSGYTLDRLVWDGIDAQEINFLNKPFNASALARKVREVLDK